MIQAAIEYGSQQEAAIMARGLAALSLSSSKLELEAFRLLMGEWDISASVCSLFSTSL